MKRFLRKFIIFAALSVCISKSYPPADTSAHQTQRPAPSPTASPVITIENVEETFSTKEQENVETVVAGEAIVLPETPQEVPTPTPNPQKQVFTVEFTTEPVKTPVPTPTPTPEPVPECSHTPPQTSEPAPEVTPTIVPNAEVPAPTTPQPPPPTVQPEVKPTPVPIPVPGPDPVFDIGYWISFAQNYAQGIGLVLDGSAVDCWDNPIPAGPKCLYIERDITDRLNRYKNLEGFTDVWIWSEQLADGTYSIYIGYA